MGMHTYFKSLAKLERIVRCPGEFKLDPHNVASHSFKVAQYCQFLGEVEERNGAKIDWKSLYEKAINHDVPEQWVGDVKSPVKYFSPELRELIHQVEEGMTTQFIESEIPDEFKAMYHEKLKEGKDGSLEGNILAVADKMDQVYEAFIEIQKGNSEKEFVKMYCDAIIAIKGMPLACAAYFLERVLPDMVNDDLVSSINIKQITEELLQTSL
jgi:putative hydrolases of HD superfamily